MHQTKKQKARVSMIIELFAERKKRIFLIFFLGLCGVLFDVLAPLPFKLLIDNVLGGLPLDGGVFGKDAFEQFSPLMLGFVAVILYGGFNILAASISFLASTETKVVVKQLTFQFSRKTFEVIERMRHSSYDEKDVGDYIYRLSSNISALGEILESGLLPIVNNTFFVCGTTVVLFLINPLFASLSLLVIPLIAGILFLFDKRLGNAWRRTERSNSLVFSFVEEIFSQLKNVQAFNQERFILSVFERKESRSLENEFRAYHLYFVLQLCIGLVITTCYAGVITFGISLVFANTMSAGALILFLFYLDNLVNPCVGVMSAITTMREQWVKLNNIFDITQGVSIQTNRIHRVVKNMHAPNVIFEHVTVTGINDAVILKKISFSIPKNAITVLVGANGSGKTTITSTLMGFYGIAKGRVMFDDTDISSLSVSSLRDMIAYVPQEATLFNGTICENIIFGNPRASIQDVHRAARNAHAHEFIMKKSGGYHSFVGEKGSHLSGGQRQRILIARALLKEYAPIVIMDEPFSSQDVKMHQALIKSLKLFSHNKTVLIVSNTLDVIRIAKHVIMVNEGRVIAEGGHESLLQQKRISQLLISLR
ncbi:MAG: ABC transporter ATP-binding protein [Candidatus Uhrbacteria bacterium]|nr:ABC transporter ATP-binding protein [Candidatus Uhrbacteria bacterium]